MEDSPRLTSRTVTVPSVSGQAARGALGAVTAIAVALAALVVIGVISWGVVRGSRGFASAARWAPRPAPPWVG